MIRYNADLIDCFHCNHGCHSSLLVHFEYLCGKSDTWSAPSNNLSHSQTARTCSSWSGNET